MVTKQSTKWLLNINDHHVHGKNILAKINNIKNLSILQKKNLSKAIAGYKDFFDSVHKENIIELQVNALNKYKDLVENFDFSAQSKFHSTILEEFLIHLFSDLLNTLNRQLGKSQDNKIISLGGTRAYSNLYFAPKNLASFFKSPEIKINEKDQDFSIFRSLDIKIDGVSRTVNVPVVSIEVKTYLDKTMLEGSIATAEKIKNGNPYCLFLVVTEWYDVSFDVDPKYSRIDQIYVLRKQKRKSVNNKPISLSTVEQLFTEVKSHLEREWSNIENRLQNEGKIL